MVAGHPGGHGGGAAIPVVVVGHSTESAVVQILPQVGVEVSAVEVVAGVNLATEIIVQVRVCNRCHFNLSIIKVLI